MLFFKIETIFALVLLSAIILIISLIKSCFINSNISCLLLLIDLLLPKIPVILRPFFILLLENNIKKEIFKLVIF